MDYKDKINEALTVLNSEEPFGGVSFNNVLWPVSIGLVIMLISAILLKAIPKDKWSSPNTRTDVTAIIGMSGFFVFFVGGLIVLICNLGASMTQDRNAVHDIKEASKEAIYQNFKISEDDMVDPELEFYEKSHLVKELEFEYTDLESMTRYDLTFLFNKETYEPSLLKTATVDDNLIRKLTNK